MAEITIEHRYHPAKNLGWNRGIREAYTSHAYRLGAWRSEVWIDNEGPSKAHQVSCERMRRLYATAPQGVREIPAQVAKGRIVCFDRRLTDDEASDVRRWAASPERTATGVQVIDPRWGPSLMAV